MRTLIESVGIVVLGVVGCDARRIYMVLLFVCGMAIVRFATLSRCAGYARRLSVLTAFCTRCEVF